MDRKIIFYPETNQIPICICKNVLPRYFAHFHERRNKLKIQQYLGFVQELVFPITYSVKYHIVTITLIHHLYFIVRHEDKMPKHPQMHNSFWAGFYNNAHICIKFNWVTAHRHEAPCHWLYKLPEKDLVLETASMSCHKVFLLHRITTARGGTDTFLPLLLSNSPTEPYLVPP